MAIQKINLGTEPHGVGGDSYRTANDKINKNFEEVSANITNVDEKYSNTEVKITEEIARAKQVEDELKANLEKEVSRAVSAEADILGVVESESRARTAEDIRINEAQTQLKTFFDSEVEKLSLEDASIKTDLEKTHRYAVMSQTLGLGSKFYDKDGQPLSGGKVYTYESGTSTLLDTYKDVEFQVSNTNPIILDETGSADVFLKGTYRFRIFDKNEVFVEEQEGVRQIFDSASAKVISDKLDALPFEGGVLADTFVVVDGSITQAEVNKGLESIADLSTIKNPKDGLRVYVKSYHVGLGKGGGYFTYDNTKSSQNNGGTIVNGWVKSKDNGYSVLDFGAKGDGLTDDTQAFVDAKAQGVVEVPSGNYIADESKLDRYKLIGDGFINGIRAGYSYGTKYTLEDFKGIVSDDATQSLKNAITACKQGGVLSGQTIYIPCKRYTIKELMVIDAPISIMGMSSGNNSNNNTAPNLVFSSTSGFDFKSTAGYCNIRDVRLSGTKAGSINLNDDSFGNYGLRFSHGSSGKFENMIIEGFDCGRVTYKAVGSTWGGAYRYFNYVKFYQNTYNTVQKGYTTDDHFFQCDFRSTLLDRTGYVYINGTGGEAYQSTNFIDCTFELIGAKNLTSFDTCGIQIKGRSQVKIIGGYQELVTKFIDAGASLVSNSFIWLQSGAVAHVGAGKIDISQSFAHAREIKFPRLSDDTFWRVAGAKYDLFTDIEGVSAYKFTLNSPLDSQYPQITSSNFSEIKRVLSDAMPLTANMMTVLVELEYKAPVGRDISFELTTAVEATWNIRGAYDNTNGWRRKIYTMNLSKTTAEVAATGKPIILFGNAQAGDVFYIKTVRVTLLAD